jgi:phospholipase/carboxylesterase
MPEYMTTRRDDRPTEGFITSFVAADPARPVRLFLPADYQPKYAYPLLVLFHAAGDDEDSAARLVPGLSMRNYIAASLRGSVPLGPGATGRPGFDWSERDDRADDYLMEAVALARRQYHIHSERVYFVGVGEGATAAYRLGLALAGDVAGVVALNGKMPSPSSRPLARLKAVRGTRVFIGHGVNNPVVPVATARQAYRLLYAAGADVQLATYPTTHRIHPNMLRDVNRWIMSAVNTEPDASNAPTLG